MAGVIGHVTRRRAAFVAVLALVFTPLQPGLPTASGNQLETRLVTIRGLETAREATGGDVLAAVRTRTSQPTTTPMRFSMVAFEAPADSEVTFRTAHRGAWSDWEHADFLLPDEGVEVSEGPTAFTDPIWVRAADRLQLRVTHGAPEDVAVHLIDSTGLNRGLIDLATSSLGSSAAEAATPPGFVTRAQWGADESIRREQPDYAVPRMGIIHHTAGSNDYTRSESAAIVRGIYNYHVKVRGWSDIGYNFLVDKYGQVFEGRFGGVDRGVIGAHAANYNTGSFGVAVMGQFEQARPSTAAIDALTRTIAWKFEVHGIDPSPGATLLRNGERLSTLSGHGDVGSTACPGKYLYNEMDNIHRRVDALVAAGWTPITGDWDDDGDDDLGWFKGGDFALRMGDGRVVEFRFGRAGDVPVVGDWDGDGRDGIGVVRGTTWYLRDSLSSGPAALEFAYGRTGDIPLPGNWDGIPGDEAGIIRDRTWHLNDELGAGASRWSFVYGRISHGDLPITGDWQGEGRDRVGIVRDGEWHLRFEYAAGSADAAFTYGRVTRGDVPVVGNWTGNGSDRPGIVRGSGWHLRHQLAGGTADAFHVVATPDASLGGS